MSELFDTFDMFPMGSLDRFVRLRAGKVTNPYNPDVGGSDWTHPEELAVEGFLSSSSSATRTSDLDRRVSSTAVLTIPDPDSDIKVGDRIRPEPADGRMWTVSGIPARDRNPFTGWRPTMEVQLEEVVG